MADIFRAVWPVVDGSAPVDQLRAEALADLPNVLVRAHCRAVGNRASFAITRGDAVPGSGGAPLVVVVEVPAERVDHRNTARQAWREVVASAL